MGRWIGMEWRGWSTMKDLWREAIRSVTVRDQEGTSGVRLV